MTGCALTNLTINTCNLRSFCIMFWIPLTLFTSTFQKDSRNGGCLQ